MAKEYIEREAALNKLLQYADQVDCTNTLGAMIGVILRDIPAADVRPVVRGRWLHVAEAVVDTTGVCSNCCEEAVWRTRKKPYAICPNCGADMRETEPQKCEDCRHGAHWDGVVVCGKDGQRHERTDGCDKGGNDED